MKNLLLPLLVVFSLTCFSQTKRSTRYFYYTCTFKSTDGCSHDQFGKFVSYKNGVTYGYDDLFNALVKYVKPYKIIKKTFRINEYRQLSRKEYFTYKPNKFNPCKQVPIYSESIGTYTSLNLPSTASSYFRAQYFVFGGVNRELLSVSAPDSTGIYTVRFSKLVHFINDTTFTFKVLTK